jgi:hypothetical protein
MSWAERNLGRYEHARARRARARYDSVLHSYFWNIQPVPAPHVSRTKKSTSPPRILIIEFRKKVVNVTVASLTTVKTVSDVTNLTRARVSTVACWSQYSSSTNFKFSTKVTKYNVSTVLNLTFVNSHHSWSACGVLASCCIMCVQNTKFRFRMLM